MQFDPKSMHLILEKWGDEFGSAYVIGMGPKRTLVCSDPELMQTVLRERPEKYRRFSPIESAAAEMGGNGVFSVEGEAWRPQRRIVMQALAPTNFRNFVPVMHGITQRLLQRWKRIAQAGEILEMTDELIRYTVDVTTALAFGEDPNTIEDSGDVIQIHLAQIFPMLMSRTIAPFPWWRYIKLPQDRRFDRSLAVVHKHIAQLIERTRKKMQDHPSDGPHNLLEAMLAASTQEGSGITDEVIAANVLTLLVAGEDTTAHTLAWTMFFIGQDKALQQQLHAASKNALGESSTCATFEGLKSLDLFEATAMEATRLKPIIPQLVFESIDYAVLGDIALPAGTPVFFLTRPSMLDAQKFGRPEQFLPERWQAGHEQVRPHDAHAYAQFGAGPRVCPGRHLAMVELRLVLSMLARNFSLELAAEPGSIKEELDFTMHPNAMPVRLRCLP
ncbi:cytochrome P450 [Undibacterium terreum]|uniref:Cytochrome P450 n=1 Tax=Undibacterium terreum TaxID=1224302 RepID=A0A916XD63_9BURK|nr:cytochrome P450 [Undibacterium terreum]